MGGIDRDGTGAVYSFDPVGSYERESCRAAGAAQSLIQPFLDNMVSPSFRHVPSTFRLHSSIIPCALAPNVLEHAVTPTPRT